MQIFIELRAESPEVIHTSEKAKHVFERLQLARLLSNLQVNGYHINSLYGRFIFDESTKTAHNTGEKGEQFPISLRWVDDIFATGAIFALIDTDEKFLVFANHLFIGLHFWHMRRVRPLALYDVNENLNELVFNENEKLRDELYLKQFEFTFGKDAEPVSCFLNDHKLRTDEVAIEMYISEEDLKKKSR
jgi:hypothetical protein